MCPFPVSPPTYPTPQGSPTQFQGQVSFPLSFYTSSGTKLLASGHTFSVKFAKLQVPTQLPSFMTPVISSRVPQTPSALIIHRKSSRNSLRAATLTVTVFYREGYESEPVQGRDIGHSWGGVKCGASGCPFLKESSSCCLCVTICTGELTKPWCHWGSVFTVWLTFSLHSSWGQVHTCSLQFL